MSKESAKQVAKNNEWENNGRVDVAVKIKNHKCFKDELVGFEKIMPINIIIGRNNSGKSALLDAIDWSCSDDRRRATASISNQAECQHIKMMPEQIVMEALPAGEHISVEDKEDDRMIHTYCESDEILRLIDKCYYIAYLTGGHPRLDHKLSGLESIKNPKIRRQLYKRIEERFLFYINWEEEHFLSKRVFRKLSAERDISLEKVSEKFRLETNGDGATNLICRYLLDKEQTADLIESVLLESLERFKN